MVVDAAVGGGKNAAVGGSSSRWRRLKRAVGEGQVVARLSSQSPPYHYTLCLISVTHGVLGIKRGLLLASINSSSSSCSSTMASKAIFTAITRRLEGKVALITGGASGIGECTAKLFCQHGAKVVIADIQDDLGHSLVKDIGATGSSYVHCDVTNESQVSNAVDTALAKYGKLDIMFNNAGIGGAAMKPRIVDNEKADFERVLSTNVTGVFLSTKHAARVMIPARAGSIISTASASSVVGGTASHAYTCAKHAVVGLTKNAAMELGQFGIRVNCLSPYVVATPATNHYLKLDDNGIEELGAFFANLKGVKLRAEDVAQAALYFGSDDSKYVSGHNLLIDGGFVAGNPSFNIFNYPDS